MKKKKNQCPKCKHLMMKKVFRHPILAFNMVRHECPNCGHFFGRTK